MSFLTFTKMHGLGNDFVVLTPEALAKSGLGQAFSNLQPAALAQLAQALCHRQFGVGADGMMVIAPPQQANTDLNFLFFNNDGSRAEMCGNGLRCFARYAYDNGFVKQKKMVVETLAGLLEPEVLDNGLICVNMGPPRLLPQEIPVSQSFQYQAGQAPLTVELANGTVVTGWPVSMGNPHFVVFQADQPTPLNPAIAGPELETHPAFPAKTNVEFVEQTAPTQFNVIVWERACGFTLACGTGACATVVAASLAGKLKSQQAKVILPGGSLQLSWQGALENSQGFLPVFKTGSATYSFTGQMAIDSDCLAPLSYASPKAIPV